jgi:serine/threonine-protein kinase
MNAEAAKVLGQCPRLVLAMAQHRLGKTEEARTTLAEAITKVDWSMSQVRSHDQWLWHILRREAEAMIFPNTAGFLEGKYEPRDNTERLALLGVCRFQNRTLASAQLYAAAFEANATLAEDLRLNHRLRAARSAALTGCGQGADAASLEETERKRWRDRGRENGYGRIWPGASTPLTPTQRRVARLFARRSLAGWKTQS